MNNNYRELVYALCDLDLVPSDVPVWLTVRHQTACPGDFDCSCDPEIVIDGEDLYRYSSVCFTDSILVN